MRVSLDIPLVTTLKEYQLKDLPADMRAGLSVGVMLIPQAMAYALLAGVPAIYGLYAGLIPLVVYAIFASARFVSVGPVALSSLLVLAGISRLAEPFTAQYLELVILTGFLVGVVNLLMGIFRLGFIVNFISQPVLHGFISAAAIIITASQLKHLFGMNVPGFARAYETIFYVFAHLGKVNLPTFLLGAASILIIVLLRKWHRAIPNALIVVVLGIVLTSWIGLDRIGVNIVGSIPQGLPPFEVPSFDWLTIKKLLPTVLTVAMIGLVEAISIGKVLEEQSEDQTAIDPDQELIALGLAKMGGGLFQAMPASASFGRSVVNFDNGAKTQVSSLFTALLILGTLAFLTPLFYHLPYAALSAIIIVSVLGLLKVQTAKRLWKLHRPDFYLMLATFLLTLIFGIGEGVIIGVALSVVLLLYRTTRPHVAVLGKLPDSKSYRNINRFPEAIQPEEVLIVRFDAPLFFGNAEFFRKKIIRLTSGPAREHLRVLLINASSMYEIDTEGLNALLDVQRHLKSKGIMLSFSNVIGPVRDMLHKAGFADEMGGKDCQFLYVDEAVIYFREGNRKEHERRYAGLTNHKDVVEISEE